MSDYREFKAFHRELSLGIDWSNPNAIEDAAALLRSTDPARLKRLAQSAVERTVAAHKNLVELAASFNQELYPGHRRVIDRPSFTKYLIGGNQHDLRLGNDNPEPEVYKLWYHDWHKPKRGRRQFAERDHDHRYDITGMPLDEAYRMRLRRCNQPELSRSEVWIPTKKEWRELMEEFDVEPGNAWSMTSLDIHSIHLLGAAPTSMVVEGPMRRLESYTFDERVGSITGIYEVSPIGYDHSPFDKTS
jgi:hypothetical protein